MAAAKGRAGKRLFIFAWAPPSFSGWSSLLLAGGPVVLTEEKAEEASIVATLLGSLLILGQEHVLIDLVDWIQNSRL